MRKARRGAGALVLAVLAAWPAAALAVEEGLPARLPAEGLPRPAAGLSLPEDGLAQPGRLNEVGAIPSAVAEPATQPAPNRPAVDQELAATPPDQDLLAKARSEIEPMFARGAHLQSPPAPDDGLLAKTVARAAALPGRSLIRLEAPSAAGKSTLARALAESLGRRAKVFPMDRYFKNRNEMPTGADGSPDLDQPDSLRLEQAARDVETLLAGGRVELPVYDWTTVTWRPDSGEFLSLGDGDVLVVDSIYAFHDLIADAGRGHEALNIYLDAPAALRLKRRLKRDRAQRGTSIAFNLSLWGNILDDERRFILPMRSRADVVLRTFSGEELRSLPEDYARVLAEEWAAGRGDAAVVAALKRRIAESLAADSVAP